MRFAILLLLLTAGCAPTIMQVGIAPADVAAARAALEPGDAVITGSAVMRQQGGGTVTCAGNEVHLVPATGSATSELTRVFGAEEGYVRRGGSTTMGGGTLVVPPEPNRTVLCNAQGFFRFSDVRPGRWHVMTAVVWAAGENYQGGTILVTTEVASGQEVEVVLSH
jgi:hypothetical protein